MKKKLITAGIILSLCAGLFGGCGMGEESGDNSTAKEIVGTWVCPMDVSDAFDLTSEEWGESVKAEECLVYLEAVFKEDGTYTMGLEKKKTKESLEKAFDEMLGYLLEYEEETHGLSEQDLRKQVEEEEGMTLEELLFEKSGVDDLDTWIDDMNDSNAIKGKYEVDGDKLYASDTPDGSIDRTDYDEIKLDGDTLVTGLNDLAPMVWTKVK